MRARSLASKYNETTNAVRSHCGGYLLRIYGLVAAQARRPRFGIVSTHNDGNELNNVDHVFCTDRLAEITTIQTLLRTGRFDRMPANVEN